jgi:hypothetical protein
MSSCVAASRRRNRNVGESERGSDITWRPDQRYSYPRRGCDPSPRLGSQDLRRNLNAGMRQTPQRRGKPLCGNVAGSRRVLSRREAVGRPDQEKKREVRKEAGIRDEACSGLPVGLPVTCGNLNGFPSEIPCGPRAARLHAACHLLTASSHRRNRDSSSCPSSCR